MQVVTTDATSAGETARALLVGVPSPVSLRELISLRVRDQVASHNASARHGARLDWQSAADEAIAGFERNGYFVFVGERQVDDLDELLSLAESDVVTFLLVYPLAGG